MISSVSATTPAAPFVHAVRILHASSARRRTTPDELPALRGLERLELDPRVTFLVGENGSGKSTLIEAIAVAAKLNAEGGGKLLKFATRSTHSRLHRRLELERVGAAAAQRVLPPRGERLQPRHRDRGERLHRRPRGRLQPAAARAVARRVVPRHRREPARPARPLPLRRAGGGALGAAASSR